MKSDSRVFVNLLTITEESWDLYLVDTNARLQEEKLLRIRYVDTSVAYLLLQTDREFYSSYLSRTAFPRLDLSFSKEVRTVSFMDFGV